MNISTKIHPNIKKVLPKDIANRRMPRYMYHFTSMSHCDSIELEKCISKNFACLGNQPDGIYMVELPNFLKRWKENSIKNFEKIHLGFALILQAMKMDKQITVYRIPTKQLNKRKFRIRNQEVLSMDLTDNIEKISKVDRKHILQGLTIKNAPHLKQHKKPIEYIYGDNINLEKCQKLGDSGDIHKILIENGINLESISLTNLPPTESQKNVLINVLKQLFKGMPEEKALDKYL